MLKLLLICALLGTGENKKEPLKSSDTLLCASDSTAHQINERSGYDEDLVEVVSVAGQYDAVFMSRNGDHIKAKYFAAKDGNKSIEDRYNEWSKGRNVIMYTSGTYMDNSQNPVGLTIDNGVTVNNTLEKFDGLVIVYATGGVVATNLKNKDLKMKCNGTNQNFDLTDAFQKNDFIKCAADVQATVFQTHLLVYGDKVLGGNNGSRAVRERRFLAVCKNSSTNEIKHVIVNTPSSAAASVIDASRKVYDMIKKFGAGDIIFMVNLDTGMQDVFKLYDSDGVSVKMKGTLDLNVTSNLLVYYYE